MKKMIVIAAVGILLAGVNSAHAEQKEKVFAKIGKEKITQSTVDQVIDQLPPQFKAKIKSQMATPEAQKELSKNIVDRVIADKVFSREARRLKLDRKPEVKEKIKTMTDRILVSEYMAGLKDQVKVSEAELKAYYEKNKSQYQEPEKIKARHILLKTEKEALAVQKELKAGKKFEQLAKENSVCPSKNKGGDLGWFGRGRMVPEFETTAFKLKKGGMSGIVKTKFGYHIIRLDDRKAAKKKSYASVKGQIESQLKQQKMNDEIKKEQAKLEKEFKVKRFDEAFK